MGAVGAPALFTAPAANHFEHSAAHRGDFTNPLITGKIAPTKSSGSQSIKRP